MKEKNENLTSIYMNWAESRLNNSFIDLKLQNDWDDWNKIAETKLRWWWLDWWLNSLNCKTDSMNQNYLKYRWFMF